MSLTDRLLVGHIGQRIIVVLCLAVASIVGSQLPNVTDAASYLLLGIGAGLFMIGSLLLAVLVHFRVKAYFATYIFNLGFGSPELPALITTVSDRCLCINSHGLKIFPNISNGARLSDALASWFVDPENTVEKMIATARDGGIGSETFGHHGECKELSARLLRGNLILWKVGHHEDRQSTSLETTPYPTLSLNASSDILAMNTAAETLLGTPKTLDELIEERPIRQGGLYKVATVEGIAEATIFSISQQGDAQTLVILPVENSIVPSAGTMLSEPRLLDALPVPMLKVAADGALIEANPEARSILSLEDAALPPLFELVEGMGRPIAEWLGDAALGRGLLKPEIVRAVIPGKELFLQITLGRIFDAGEVVLVGILNDATELKTLEAQFVQSQKMQAIGQLAGGVAHDFNNLLTAISGHCDLLLLRHDHGDPDYADLIQISQNANRAASLVGQLLAFSRKQNLKPKVLDLRDTMSDLAHLLNRLIGERIRLDVNHGPGSHTIRADRRQLEQVLVNLVVNARDAMPDGGEVVITTCHEEVAEEFERDRARIQPGGYVVIKVQDSGSGISPEGLSKIFEPFYTTKKTGEGTGLGLSTAYGIVKQTGGFIFAESVQGEGTSFSLYFPEVESLAVEDVPASEITTPTNTHMDGVVLLVEDEAPVRAFASRALKMRGYTVIEAECAEDALTMLDNKDLDVDVFVTDVVMPGMDGPTWVRKALKRRPDTKVVFVSGYAEERSAEKQSRIPNSVFLPKPFSLQQLTSLVQEQLH